MKIKKFSENIEFQDPSVKKNIKLKDLYPTEKEAEDYARGYFGYEKYSSYQENAFVSGVEWAKEYIENKKNNDK